MCKDNEHAIAMFIFYLFKVRHSQRMNETPLGCWAVLEENGEIYCAHCNCIAGLGETCTHVAAMLFYLETVVRMKGTRTCTQSQCAWVIPSYVKSVDYQPIKILTSHLPMEKNENLMR